MTSSSSPPAWRSTRRPAWSSGHPTADQVGEQDVILRVQDGQGGVDLQSFRVTVRPPTPPRSSPRRPAGPAVVGKPYQYQVRAQDADGDPITFRLDAAPHRHDHRRGDGRSHLDPDGRPGRQPARRGHRRATAAGRTDDPVVRPARRRYARRQRRPRSPRLPRTSDPAGRHVPLPGPGLRPQRRPADLSLLERRPPA